MNENPVLLKLVAGCVALLISGCAALPVSRAPDAPALPPVEERVPAGAPLDERARDVPDASHEAAPPASAAVVALLDDAAAKERAGDTDKAIVVLERAVRIEPRNAHVWQRLARVYLQHGDAAQAEAMARKSTQFAGGDTRLQAANWRVIAAARRQRGDLKGADAADAQASLLDAKAR